MDIHIKTIPENEQRPNVSGADWFFDEAGNLQVRISPMSDWRFEAMLGIHEAVEALLCKDQGITVEMVDEFDSLYDSLHDNDVEAGDDPNAPYAVEHSFATAAERMLCAYFNVSWKKYDDELKALYPSPSKREQASK